MRYLSVLLLSSMLLACTTTQGGSTKKISNAMTRDDLSKSDKIVYQMGEEYIRNGEYKVAEERLMTLVSKYPNFTDLYIMLGAVQEGQGKKTAAVTYYSKAISMNPLDRTAIKSYARLQCDPYDKNAPEKMASIADSALSELKAGMNSGASGCYLIHENYAKANDYADRALAANPQYGDTYFFKAVALNGLKRYSEVFPALDKYHDQYGYDAGSVGIGLDAAQKSGNKAELAKYENIAARN